MGTYIVKRLNGEPMNMRRDAHRGAWPRRGFGAGSRHRREEKHGWLRRESIAEPADGLRSEGGAYIQGDDGRKGTVGVDYDFSGTYRSSAVSKVVYNDAWEMAMESEFKHIKKKD